MEMITLLVGDRLTVGQMPPVEIIDPYPTTVRYYTSEKVAGFLDRSEPVGCVMPLLPDDEVPTIGALAKSEPRWIWANCNTVNCGHARAVPLIPFLIRWGADASSNLLRQNLSCSKCGARGVYITLPSRIGSHGAQEFPTERAMIFPTSGKTSHHDS